MIFDRYLEKLDPERVQRFAARASTAYLTLIVVWMAVWFGLGVRAYYQPRLSTALLFWWGNAWIILVLPWSMAMVAASRVLQLSARRLMDEADAHIRELPESIARIAQQIERDLRAEVYGEDSAEANEPRLH
jgi:hypothetical protein